jgi:hypothetical protein
LELLGRLVGKIRGVCANTWKQRDAVDIVEFELDRWEMSGSEERWMYN